MRDLLTCQVSKGAFGGYANGHCPQKKFGVEQFRGNRCPVGGLGVPTISLLKAAVLPHHVRSHPDRGATGTVVSNRVEGKQALGAFEEVIGFLNGPLTGAFHG